MLGQIVQALMVEMVREMNIFADSGTAGIDLSSLQTGQCKTQTEDFILQTADQG